MKIFSIRTSFAKASLLLNLLPESVRMVSGKQRKIRKSIDELSLKTTSYFNMPFKQNRRNRNRNRNNPPWITNHEEMEYKRLEEWRKQQLQQRQQQQRNARFQTAAKHQPRVPEQETRANQMRSREYMEDPVIRQNSQAEIFQNSQAEILQTLQAFKEQHELQFELLKHMVFQIQRQVLSLQKRVRVQQTSYTPYPPIVVKRENPESATEDS